MNRICKIMLCTCIGLSLVACSSGPKSSLKSEDVAKTTSPSLKTEKPEVKAVYTNNVKRYADQLVDQVVKSIEPGTDIDKVAIATPVDVATLESTDWLGRELAEYFVNSLHKRGFSVLEYKLKGWLEITDQGDYIYSRNWQKLATKAKVSRILSGTMSRSDSGVTIYARLVNLRNSTVDGSADIFIPYEDLPKCYSESSNACYLTTNRTSNSTNTTANNNANRTVTSNTQNANNTNRNNRNNKGNESTLSTKTDKNNVVNNRNTTTNSNTKKDNVVSNNNVKPNGNKPNSNKPSSNKPNSPANVQNTRVNNSTGTQIATTNNKDNQTTQNIKNIDGSLYTSNGTAGLDCTSCKYGSKSCHNKCSDPVIYNATTRSVDGFLIRDVGGQSQYDRR